MKALQDRVKQLEAANLQLSESHQALEISSQSQLSALSEENLALKRELAARDLRQGDIEGLIGDLVRREAHLREQLRDNRDSEAI